MSFAPFDDDELRSKLPAVFGVFADDPKDAKAPEPRPKADDAPAEGEETFVDSGEAVLKGFERPVPPSDRFVEDWVRGESERVLIPSRLSAFDDVETESLL